MSSIAVASNDLPPALAQARAAAVGQAWPYAGDVSPQIAWQLVGQGAAVLVDVRSSEECKFVGRVPASLHVPWATGIALTHNPRFLLDLETHLAGSGGKNAVALMLCRSGKRSMLAAQAATQAGFTNAFNVLEGFEGDLDEMQQRGRINGWRFHGLPWVQD
ncbi:MAG: rhodanese-like domain-containing protein [Burkholderiaceae bacterium]|nr:rhodanese-like domain-containing protein [Burkholderiaceae bacterium]